MARRPQSHSTESIESDADRLQSAVFELAQNVRVLTDIVDAIREDLSWLTRNGMPHQPITVIVHRMPRVAEEGSRGTMELSFAHLPQRDPTETLTDDQVRTAVIDDVVQRLAEPVGELAQQQLSSLVSTLDHAHRDVLQAIRGVRTPPTEEPAPKRARRPKRKQENKVAVVPTVPPEPPPPPGRLF
jgi:hypothetical protein